MAPLESSQPARQPWIRGIAESLSAAKLIIASKLGSRNRHALILLDSTLEIAFKEFLLYVVGIRDLETTHTQYRDVLHKIVKRNTTFSKDVWDSIEFFYERRCNLYHEDAASTLTDDMIFDFFNLVIWTTDSLFGTQIQGMIQSPESLRAGDTAIVIDVNEATTQVDALLFAISDRAVFGPGEVMEELNRLGYRGKISAKRVSDIMASPSYRHLFHRTSTSGGIELSQAGMKRFKEVLKGTGAKR